MNNITVSLVCDLFCIGLSVVFLWSTLIVLVGLIRPARRHPKASGKLKFAVLVCARNEESVIRLPVKSVLLSKYPAECREVIARRYGRRASRATARAMCLRGDCGG